MPNASFRFCTTSWAERAIPALLRFCSLASGSSGNATLVESHDGLRHTRVLIDCGLGMRQLDARLAALGLKPDTLDAIFITHEHGDHLGCAFQLGATHGIPLWMSAGTHAAARQKTQGHKHQPPVQQVADGQTISIGGLQLQAFAVPHDAHEPLQLHCSDGARRLGLLTDLGHVTSHVLRQLAGCHALILESNHDSELLAHSSDPDFLKRRIGGPLGHLSNAQAAQALTQLQHSGLRQVVAAHLSERNNRPELVRQAFSQALGCAPGDVLTSNRKGLGWLSV